MSKDWRTLLRTIVERPAVVPGDEHALRAGLMVVDCCSPDVDDALADGWRAAAPLVRQQALRDALEALPMGAATCAALVDSATSDEHVSANAALHLLGHCETAPLTPTDWRRIGARAVAQRDALLPDIEAAQLLAEKGPPQAYATLVLLAFRAGPEDAEDRQYALSALGRFGRPEVLTWLADVAATGALGIEVATAVADFAARALAADEPVPAAAVAALEAVVGVGRGDGIDAVDCWQRWAGIDVLSRLVGERALPIVASAWRAGGEDAEVWYDEALAQRCRDLLPADPDEPADAPALVRALANRGVELPAIAPVPPIRGRAFARSPRISRRAMVMLERSDTPAADVAAIREERARIEQALVQRSQLMGSFLTTADTEAAELDDSWRPTCEVLPEPVRATMLQAEAAWLGT